MWSGFTPGGTRASGLRPVPPRLRPPSPLRRLRPRPRWAPPEVIHEVPLGRVRPLLCPAEHLRGLPVHQLRHRPQAVAERPFAAGAPVPRRDRTRCAGPAAPVELPPAGDDASRAILGALVVA